MCRIGQFQRRSSRNETGHNMILLVGVYLFMCALVNTVSCRSFDENTLTNEEQGNDRNKQLDGDDAQFDWQLSTDNVDFYKILHKIDLDEIITFLEKGSSDVGDVPSVTRRQKRSTIFGKDDRKQIPTSLDVEIMPYAASVRISTGCTGTLIGPRHVLTAAHCVYKGPRRKTKRRLKVGFLHMSGKVRWRKVRRVHAPREWHTLSAQYRGKYDYAVLELRRDHKRQYMTPVTFHRSQGYTLQFNGFPGDKKENTMWYSRCSVHKTWKSYLINRCDVARGMSGSGSYLRLNKKNYVVRGLVIASVQIKFHRFNVINPLTPAITKQICKWMRAGSDCKSFK